MYGSWPEVRDAIFVASPDLDDAIAGWEADPDSEKGQRAERALASAATGGWLAAGAIAVVEERKGAAIALPAGFVALDQRGWGDTQALFARFTGNEGPV